MAYDSPCQLKRPHGLEQKTLNYKKTWTQNIYKKICMEKVVFK